MKKVILLILMVCSILIGCSGDGEILSEMDLKNVNNDVKSFIEHAESAGEDIETGIYMYTDSKNQRYLYLNQDFLDKGRTFGNVDVNTDENSINIYLDDMPISEGEVATYKFYKINIQEDYEYLKVFKNSEETHFTNIGYK